MQKVEGSNPFSRFRRRHYRYAARDDVPRTFRDFELPDEIAQRCVDLSHSLGMALTGVDLRRDLDGEWWCFETHTGQPIGHAVADMLRTARS
jgi:hypothetical protein